MTGGSPSLARSRLTVIRTALVKGSAISSQAPSRSASLETTAPWARQQQLQDAELLGAQGHRLAGPGDDPMGGVELDVAVDQRRRQRGARPPGQRTDAGHQLGDGERLGQVVIRA